LDRTTKLAKIKTRAINFETKIDLGMAQPDDSEKYDVETTAISQ
jgi:hypothetical protein